MSIASGQEKKHNSRTRVAVMQSAHVTYDDKFFNEIVDGATRSARLMAPLVIRLAHPKSVIDIGCGEGAWLKSFVELGVEDVLGIDGAYVDPGRLLIEKTKFQAMDLSRPEPLGRTFDLAMSLEVAEHLPARVAASFVEMLVKAAPLVVFSAAIPNQGGTHHVNEQWPTYWERLFSRHGYQRLDPFRRHMCFDFRIPWWYRQNIFLYASPEAINRSEELQEEKKWAMKADMELVYSNILGKHMSLSGLLRMIPSVAWRALRNRLTFRR